MPMFSSSSLSRPANLLAAALVLSSTWFLQPPNAEGPLDGIQKPNLNHSPASLVAAKEAVHRKSDGKIRCNEDDACTDKRTSRVVA